MPFISGEGMIRQAGQEIYGSYLLQNGFLDVCFVSPSPVFES